MEVICSELEVEEGLVVMVCDWGLDYSEGGDERAVDGVETLAEAEEAGGLDFGGVGVLSHL